MTLRVEAADEKERLALDAAARAKEKLEKERKAEEEEQTRKMAEQMAKQRASMKVVKTKKDEDGKKIETTVDGLAKKTRQELIKEQRELMIDERVSFEERLLAMAHRHDHIERARREEERVLLRLAWEKQQKEEEAEHLKTVELLRVQATEGRAHDLAEKARLSQMTPAVEAFKARVMTQRNVAHEKVLAAWRVEQAARKEAARLEKERLDAERKAQEEELDRLRREAEEELEREREREERRKRKEARREEKEAARAEKKMRRSKHRDEEDD